MREPKPKEPTQEPTHASLTAEGFVALVDFQTLRSRLENVRTHSEREKLRQNLLGNHNEVQVTKGLVPWSTRLVSNSQSVIKRVGTVNSYNRGSVLNKLRYFLLFCNSFNVTASQKHSICACCALSCVRENTKKDCPDGENLKKRR